MITDREQVIIKHLVEAYINNGNPVGSETLLKESSLKCSSATIRNELVALEKRGLIRSTHHSSGRIPTVRGYRLFIDNCMTRKPLTSAEKQRLKAIIVQNKGTKNILESTSLTLSNLTDLAAVITPIEYDRKVFQHIEFHKLSSNKILAILISNNDDVYNRIFNVSLNLDEKKLNIFKNYLNENFVGQPIDEIPGLLKKGMTAIRNEINMLLKILTEFIKPDEAGCIVNGQSKLVENDDLSNINKIRNLIELFEKKQTLAYLLTECINTDGIKIFIGNESGEKLLTDCSLIAAPYMKENKIIGVLGVIGPHRINYQKVMEIVDFTAKIISKEK